MQVVRPGIAEHVVRLDAQEFEVGLVHVLHPLQAAYPDQDGGAVHQRAEARLAPPELRLRFSPLADVLGDADAEGRPALRTRNDEPVQLDPHRLSIFPEIALLTPHRRHIPGAQPLEVLALQRQIVGVRDVFGPQGQQRVTRAARQLAEAVIHALEPSLQIGLEDSHRGPVVHDPQPFRTNAQRLGGLLDRIDIDQRLERRR